MTITIQGANDVPKAVGDGFSTDEATVLSIAARAYSRMTRTSILPTSLWLARSTRPDRWKSTWKADGSFVYDPEGHFDYLVEGQTALDTFSYVVGDGHGGTSMATVRITINGVGTAGNQRPRLERCLHHACRCKPS